MRSVIRILFIAAVCSVCFIGKGYFSRASLSEDSRHFSVLTWNIGNAGEKPPGVDEIAAQISKFGHPDIVLLQEVGLQERLQGCANALGYKYFVQNKPGKQCDTAIMSDFALNGTRSLAFPAPKFSGDAVLAKAAAPWGDFLVASVHLPAIPKDRAKDGTVYVHLWDLSRIVWDECTLDTARVSAAERLVQEIHAEQESGVILGGDFNTLAFTRAVRKIRSAFNDAFWLRPEMFFGTYVKVEHGLYPRIDYIFSDDLFCAENISVGHIALGDHLPIFSTFLVREH